MMHANADYIAVGSTTTKANLFYQPGYENMLAADTDGALLSIYSSDVNEPTEPLKATLISTISSTVTVNGFKNINMGEEHAYAVLDTSDDSSGQNIYLVSYNVNNHELWQICNGQDASGAKIPPCHYRKQLQILKLSSSTSPLANFMLTSNKRVWLSGEYDSPTGILTIVMEHDRYGNLEVTD